MFTLPHLALRQSAVAKQYGDMVEDAEAARLRANAQARGEVEPDLGKDLPKYVNGSYLAACGAAQVEREFYPQRTDNQVRSRLANVDGVAVPNLPIFKTLFKWMK
jgi:hypothetical protein